MHLITPSLETKVRDRLIHFKTSRKIRQTSTSKTPQPFNRPGGMRASHSHATLKQSCYSEYQGAQDAVKDSMISAIHITFRTFAASFIDAKAKRSVVESCIAFLRTKTCIYKLGVM